MPSERFLKLSDEKKARILQAGFREFSRESLRTASINSIIKEADISRGSFYTYFEDKEDLFAYLLESTVKEFTDRVCSCLDEADGDAVNGMVILYEKILKTVSEEKEARRCFMDNVFKNPEMFRQMLMPGDPGCCGEQRLFRNMQEQVRSHVDQTAYQLGCEGEAIQLMLSIVMQNVGASMLRPEHTEEHRERLERGLYVLKYGILRRTETEGKI